MKIQKYIVTIEMPDGDTISPSWLKDLIQTDCDVEECDRQKVSVEEFSKPELPSELDDAAENRVTENGRFKITSFEKMRIDDIMFGAEWMKEQIMEKAAGADVNTYKDLATGKSWAEFVVKMPTNNLGDKARIIIVEEDKK